MKRQSSSNFKKMVMLSFNYSVLLGSVSTSSLKKNAMLLVKKESMTLSTFLSIVTLDGFDFSIKLMFNKQH